MKGYIIKYIVCIFYNVNLYRYITEIIEIGGRGK